MPQGGLTPQEIRLRKCLIALAVMFFGFTLSYYGQGFFGQGEFPFVANSVTKDAFFAAMCVLGIADMRRFTWAILLIIVGHVILIGSLLMMVAFGKTTDVTHTLAWGPTPPGDELIWIWIFLAFFVIVVLTALYESALIARYQLRYLSNFEWVTVQALAEVLIPQKEAAIPTEAVAHHVDQYLASFTAHDKWKIRAALIGLTFIPLLYLRPPWPIMSIGMRKRFIKKHFLGSSKEGRTRGPVRDLTAGMMRAAQQMVYLGYYGDEHAAKATAGYLRFSQRPGYEEAMARVPKHRPKLEVAHPDEVDAETIHADVAIVGSGAAGSILAYRLADQGRDVVVLERGPHIDPTAFSEDEKVQISTLYRDGALQLSRDLRFSVLQGMCVGGSTVVNNAVCFDLPDRVLRRWNDRDGFDAGLDPDLLAEKFRELRDWLPVVPQSENGSRFHQAGAPKFAEGVRKLGLDRGGDFEVFDANILDCLGSGYCNIGCQWGKKLSALDTTFPRAQHRFGPERVRIVSECDVRTIERAGRRAVALECILGERRKLRVDANTIVVAGGAIASSLLIQRSGIKSPAGERLGFNLATPLTADFPERLDAYAGMQMCSYVRPPGTDGLVLETWFNPAMMQALFMPGWFEDHWHNMQRYP
jgi:hypothetical protein